MSVPLAKRDPILKRFHLRSLKLDTAAGPMRLVTPRSSSDLIRRDSDDIPHWADVWPASVAIARCLTRGPSLVGTKAMDLGCGLGVAGVGAGMAGASVVFTDREADALAFAAFHAERNGLKGSQTQVHDWSRDLPDDAIDLLILADVCYEYRHVEPMLAHIRAVVARNGGRALWADPHRPTGNDVFAKLEREGRYRLDVAESDCHVDGLRSTLRLAWIESR